MTALATRPSVAFEHPTDVADLVRVRKGTVRFLDVPERRFLAVDGTGDPGASPEFRAAIETLYPVWYTLKFALRPRGVQMPGGMLEGLFATDRPGPLLHEVIGPAPAWGWTLLLAVSDEATDEEIAAAIGTAGRKRPLPARDRLRVERWSEGPSAQILHVGPYDAEVPTIERLHSAIAAAGLHPRGRHHEIYLGDPRRSAPERLRTIIRQPVARLSP